MRGRKDQWSRGMSGWLKRANSRNLGEWRGGKRRKKKDERRKKKADNEE